MRRPLSDRARGALPACETCGAAAGQPCRSLDGLSLELRTVHGGRYAVAIGSCVTCGAETRRRHTVATRMCDGCRSSGPPEAVRFALAAATRQPFALSLARVASLLADPCTYCGGAGGSVDRIDPALGYVEGNVAPACKMCNAMKLDTALDAWLEHVARIAAHTADHETDTPRRAKRRATT